jgi:hypothetical protein
VSLRDSLGKAAYFNCNSDVPSRKIDIGSNRTTETLEFCR